ncbi:MAG TPA: multidrug effflux MFS transporter [Ideonella sp.]|nr:multidrug effflux MFS transporter [Ideonella sp.]
MAAPERAPGRAAADPRLPAASGDAAAGRMAPMSPAVVALALALLLGLQPITTDLYLPALPMLARELAAPFHAVQLTMSAVLLSFGFAQLAMGPLSDRFGRRPVLLGGLSLYALASLGAVLAPDIAVLVAFRALQGVGMAASVVCARAMVRDLYEPHEGAPIMSRGLSGLGVIAIVGPALGGLLATQFGWRAALMAVAAAGVFTAGFAWRCVPETARALNPLALDPKPLLRTAGEVLRHPGFRAWTALISSTYGGLFVLLAGSSFVYIGTLGLPPWGYGLAMASASLAYLSGTVYCRHLLPRLGLTGAVKRGAFYTLAGGLLMVATGFSGLAPAQALLPVLLAHWLYAFGHGIHQPCGQTAAVGAFPQAAGVASALSGFVLALTAFFVGLWLGAVLDGQLATLALGLGFFALLTSGIAWTLVQRHGERFVAPVARQA